MKIHTSLLAAVAIAGTAHAAGMTIYKQPDFSGRSLDVRGVTRDLTGSGFIDQASSAVVHSGHWQLCSQPDFQGDCTVLGPGRYDSLDPSIYHRVESVRPVHRAHAGLTLFRRPGFDGKSLALADDARSLRGSGLDARASSLIVHSGRWQVCSDPGYRGECLVLGPGRYAHLDRRLNNRIESAREVSRHARAGDWRPGHAARLEWRDARSERYAERRDDYRPRWDERGSWVQGERDRDRR